MAYVFGSIWDRFNRNALNDLSKKLEQQGISIQDLVAKGQLTPSQYATLIQAVNGLISKGSVTLDDLSPEVIAILRESDPNFTLLSIPRDRSVSPEKTNFFEISENLLNTNAITHGKTVDASGNIVNDSNRWLSDYIKLPASKIISLTENSYRVQVSDDNKKFIRYLVSGDGKIDQSAGNTESYVRISATYTLPPESIMVNNGTTLKSFVPYYKTIRDEHIGNVNGESILDNSLPLEKLSNIEKSKNLANNDDLFQGHVSYQTGDFIESANNRAVKMTKVEPSTQYTISGNIPTGNINVAMYNEAGGFDSGLQLDAYAGGQQDFQVTTSSKTGYIAFSFNRNSSNIQLEKGGTATPYEQYYFYLKDIVDPRKGGGSGSENSKNTLRVNGRDDVTFKFPLTGDLFGSFRYSNASTGDDFLKGRESAVFNSSGAKLYNLTDEHSNKEFALRSHDNNGNDEWFPEHNGVPSAFIGTKGFIKLWVDGKEISLNSSSGDIAFEKAELIQKVECKLPTDSSTRAIITFVSTIEGNVNKNVVKVEWLKDTLVSSGYMFMVPMDTQNFVSTLLAEDFTQISAKPNATDSTNTQITNLENKEFFFTSNKSGKTDVVFKMKILKQTEELKDLYWQHRSGVNEKLYPKQYHQTQKNIGEIDYFVGEYSIDVIPKANEIYTNN